MTTQPANLATATDLLVWRAGNGGQPFYFPSVPDALNFVMVEMGDLETQFTAGTLQPAVFLGRLQRCQVLIAECERMHTEWEIEHPREDCS